MWCGEVKETKAATFTVFTVTYTVNLNKFFVYNPGEEIIVFGSATNSVCNNVLIDLSLIATFQGTTKIIFHGESAELRSRPSKVFLNSAVFFAPLAPGRYSIVATGIVSSIYENYYSNSSVNLPFLVISPPINATCGSNATTYPYTTTSWPSTSQTAFCSTGTLSGSTPSFPAQGATTTWTCLGQNGGSNATCSARREPAPINGSCGPANGQKLIEFPSEESQLCNRGNVKNITTTSSGWEWDCEGLYGGTTAHCSATSSRGFIEVP